MNDVVVPVSTSVIFGSYFDPKETGWIVVCVWARWEKEAAELICLAQRDELLLGADPGEIERERGVLVEPLDKAAGTQCFHHVPVEGVGRRLAAAVTRPASGTVTVPLR